MYAVLIFFSYSFMICLQHSPKHVHPNLEITVAHNEATWHGFKQGVKWGSAGAGSWEAGSSVKKLGQHSQEGC